MKTLYTAQHTNSLASEKAPKRVKNFPESDSISVLLRTGMQYAALVWLEDAECGGDSVQLASDGSESVPDSEFCCGAKEADVVSILPRC
jgi:hypothetical protein